MNNNNLYTNNNFIGTTHLDASKITSNFILATSNILEQHISVSNLNNSNFTLATSNILETHSSNFTLATSNILETHSSNFTNKLRADVNKWINEEIELSSTTPPIELTHTYIYNSNLLGEIRFATKGTPKYIANDNNNYTVKIKENGRLAIYYNFTIIYPTVLGGWYDVMDSIRDGYAFQTQTNTLIGGIQFEINNLNNVLEPLVIIVEKHNEDIVSLQTQVGLLNSINYIQQIEYKTYEELMQLIDISRETKYFDVFQNPVLAGIGIETAVGIAGSVIGSVLYAGYISEQAEFLNYTSNSNLSLQQRIDLKLNLDEIAVSSISSFNNDIRSLNLNQGFINSNIQTQQYIPSIKTEAIYVNSGNINGIDINNLKTSGNIIENGINLSNKYITSNQIYNLSNNYTAERQYPPKLYNNTQPEDTSLLKGILRYHSSLYLNNTGILYGSGYYSIFSSSTYDVFINSKDNLFNFNTADTTPRARFANSLYNSGTGNYQGNDSLDGVYYGDFVVIKMPQQISLTRYRIYQFTDTPTKAPSLWKVFGSNDGNAFYEITEASQTSRLTSYTNSYYEKTLTGISPLYSYIGFEFSALLSVSEQTELSFAELQIFGKELLNQTVVSNIYTTSNIAKNLIIYDTPQVSKHFAFYCQTTTPIFINGGNTQYYKYDIDMTNYTTTGYIQIGSGSNDPYRIFRIRAFFGSCYFSKITNGLPDILHYEIYMSSKAAAGGSGTTAGINIFAVGYPNNSSLNVIPPNNLFILSNPSNNFNYITLVSTSPADIRVVIEDLLS